MFFHPVLLHIQHKGQLGLAWKAATLGIKKIRSVEVRGCKITEMCHFIMQFLTSDSHDPKKRMSLRLTIMLVNGTVLIWRQQLAFLEGDIFSVIYAREKAAERHFTLLGENDESSFTPQPKERKKKTKKTKASETPEYLEDKKKKKTAERAEAEDLLRPLTLPEILKENFVTARPDDITLREVMPVQQQVGDNFGDEFMLQPDVERAEVQSGQQFIVDAEIHAPPRDKSMEVDLVLPGIRVDVPSEVSQPVQPIEEIVVDIQPLLPTEEPPVAPVTIEMEQGPSRAATANGTDAIVREMPLEEEPLEASRAPEFPEVAPRAAKSIIDILRIKRTKKKFVLINKPTEINVEDDFSDLIAEFTQRLPAFRPMEKFYPDFQNEPVPPAREPEEGMPIPRRTGTKSLSSVGSLRRDTTGSSLLVERPSFQRETTSPLKRPLERNETHIAELPPAANHHVAESPLKKKIIVTAEGKTRPEKEPEQIEILMEQEVIMPVLEPAPAISEVVSIIPEIGQPPQRHEESLETEEAVRRRSGEDEFGAKWYNEVLSIVTKQGKIRPVEVCKALGQRVARRNMAVLFATLLVLAKDGSVYLLPTANSIELEFVQPISLN